METTEYLPTEQLQPYIKAYRMIESKDELVNRILPGTSFTIAFRFRGQISDRRESAHVILPTITFSGLRKSVRLFHYAPDSAALVVQFNEAGINAFFRQPLHELFEESVSLDTFFPQTEMSILEEQLAEAAHNPARIALVERFLCSKLINHKPDRLVSEAIRSMYSSNGLISVKELASDLCISQDAFEKRFRKVAGTTPKQFASIIRMKAIIRQHDSPASFLDLALDNGYYDQPHFNKDFKLFTGLTPTDFFKSVRYW
ncbi:hypothetical protein GCM10027592_20530 [Spirosoma flavus]